MINTAIEWADDSINFWWGCAKVSEACRNCYAENINRVFGKGRAVWTRHGQRWVRENARDEARKLASTPMSSSRRRRVFVNSMSDTFEDHRELNSARRTLFDTIECYPQIDWILLTKRPENINDLVPKRWVSFWPAHVWIGTTVEDQDNADKRIYHLLGVAAAVRFLSIEPLLSDINLRLNRRARLPGKVIGDEIKWIVCGGESGRGARPMPLQAARGVRDQARAANVRFFFKQWGEFVPVESAEDSRGYSPKSLKYFPNLDMTFARIGKKEAGRKLDGREWNQFPETPLPRICPRCRYSDVFLRHGLARRSSVCEDCKNPPMDRRSLPLWKR